MLVWRTRALSPEKLFKTIEIDKSSKGVGDSPLAWCYRVLTTTEISFDVKIICELLPLRRPKGEFSDGETAEFFGV